MSIRIAHLHSGLLTFFPLAWGWLGCLLTQNIDLGHACPFPDLRYKVVCIKYPEICTTAGVSGEGSSAFMPLRDHCCLNISHTFVPALWSSLEQQNFMLSLTGLSLSVTNVKVTQTSPASCEITPDVLCFQQKANCHQQQQGMSMASPAYSVPRRELQHLSPSEGIKICRIPPNSVSHLPFPHCKQEQLLPICMSLIMDS